MASPSIFPPELPLDTGDPKASSHRAWLLNIHNSIASLQWFVAALSGGYNNNGVFAFGGTPENTGLVEETSPASMSLTVNAVAAMRTSCPVRIDSATEIGPFTAPVSGSRIDLIEVNVATQAIGIITGDGTTDTPAASTDGGVALASVTIGSTFTEIVNGDITDLRSFINYVPST